VHEHRVERDFPTLGMDVRASETRRLLRRYAGDELRRRTSAEPAGGGDSTVAKQPDKPDEMAGIQNRNRPIRRLAENGVDLDGITGGSALQFGEIAEGRQAARERL
jgi:hypothetical protein